MQQNMIENKEEAIPQNNENGNSEKGITNQTETLSFPTLLPGMPISFQLTPSSGLLFVSFPLLAGAYVGYRREKIRAQSPNPYENGFVKSISKQNSNVSTTYASKALKSGKISPVSNSKLIANHPGPIFFAKALLYGTFLSIGGVSLITAGVFYATDSKSLDDLIQKCRKWTPRRRESIEEFFNITSSTSKNRCKNKWANDEDVIATKNMTEDEELQYYQKKYVGNEVFDKSEN